MRPHAIKSSSASSFLQQWSACWRLQSITLWWTIPPQYPSYGCDLTMWALLFWHWAILCPGSTWSSAVDQPCRSDTGQWWTLSRISGLWKRLMNVSDIGAMHHHCSYPCQFQGLRFRTFLVITFVYNGQSGFAPLIHRIELFSPKQMNKQSGLS